MKKFLLSLVLICTVLLSVFPALSETTPAPLPVFDANLAEIGEPTPTPVPELTPTPRPNVALPGWVSLTIPADMTGVRVSLPNPKQNEMLYYLSFDLYAALPEEAIAENAETVTVDLTDKETGESVPTLFVKLYASGLVPPGYALQDIELTQAVPAGEYTGIVSIHPFYYENYMPTANTGNVLITLKAIDPNATPTPDPNAVVTTPAPPPTGF